MGGKRGGDAIYILLQHRGTNGQALLAKISSLICGALPCGKSIFSFVLCFLLFV